jgi:hypothetical protein
MASWYHLAPVNRRGVPPDAISTRSCGASALCGRAGQAFRWRHYGGGASIRFKEQSSLERTTQTPAYFLRDADAYADGGPSMRALVLTYPGRQPGAVRRGVLLTFDSEAS